MCANPLYQIDKEWAVQLVGLCRIVQGYWLNWNAIDEEKRESHKEKKTFLKVWEIPGAHNWIHIWTKKKEKKNLNKN